jgi:hypothetical protein
LPDAAQAPAQGYPVTLEEIVIPPHASKTISLATPAPLRQGMAMVWTNDASKMLQSSAVINGGIINAAQSVQMPFSVPFDTTSHGITTVNIFNPAWWGNQSLAVTEYDSAGNPIGSDQFLVPAQQSRTLIVSETAAMVGSKTGTVKITGAGAMVVMALQTAPDGTLASINPSPSKF